MRLALCARAALVIAFVIALPSPIASLTSQPRPGNYQVSVQISMRGEQDPPDADEQCFTKDDVEHLEQWLASSLVGERCSASDRKVVDGTVHFVVTCPDDAGKISTRGELRPTDNSFVAALRMSADTGIEVLETVFTMTAQRIGDCGK